MNQTVKAVENNFFVMLLNLLGIQNNGALLGPF